MARGSHMTSRYAGLNGSFSLQLDQFKQNTMASIEQTITDVVIQIGESIVNLTAVDTGALKANWHITFDRPDTDQFIGEFDKEGSTVIAQMVAAMNDFTPGQTVYILNNLPYAIPIEFGHSQKSPAGMVRITIAQFEKIVAAAAALNEAK